MVDLRKVPYSLSDEDIKWVEKTIAEMNIDEKLGQLFVNLFGNREESFLKEVLSTTHIGAARYNPGTKEEIRQQNQILQENSKIPLLIASNAESGGDGACKDGTYVGCPVKVCSTNDPEYAYKMGLICGEEAKAVGCNWSFSPVVDITKNWRNPIISNRAFSDDPKKVLEYSLQYLKGMQEKGILCAAKHFPGDGIDERDHHLSFSCNNLSCEEWDKTFGYVYEGLIKAGLPSIMVGHMSMPEYQKRFDKTATDLDILPATLCKELVTDLLKGKLGFNGLVVTDASHMVAMTSSMKREEYVPKAIAAGCDMFLFFNDSEEDLEFVMKAYKEGTLTDERVEDALKRILGLKAKLGLHKTSKTELVPKEEALKIVGSEAHKQVAREISDKGIVLVKDLDKDLLPISPKKYKKVLLVAQSGVGTVFDFMSQDEPPVQTIKAKLEKEGFEVDIFVSIKERMEGLSPQEKGALILDLYSQKASIKSFVQKYDLVIHLADVNGMMLPFQRIVWSSTKGTHDIPWYVHEVPTIFISLCCPFHLADVPQMRSYINCYDKKDHTLNSLCEKLMGRSEFVGVSSVDAFCGFLDTHL